MILSKVILLIKSLFRKISVTNTPVIPIKIGIVDDHELMRKGLCMLITTPDHTILFEGINGRELIEKIDSKNLPDVVFVDINMPGMDGFETTLWLKQNYSTVKVLAMGLDEEENTIIRLLRNGAKGYISKAADPDEFKATIKAIVKKGFYFSRELRIGSDLVRYDLIRGNKRK